MLTYRSTIVGEASHPGPVDPGAVPRGRRSTVGRRWGLIDLKEGRPCLSGGEGSPVASPMGESRRPCRGPPSAGGGLACPREGGLCPPDGEASPEAWASPGLSTGVFPLACIGQGRARVPAMATGVSLLVKPPIPGLSPPLTSQVLRRRENSEVHASDGGDRARPVEGRWSPPGEGGEGLGVWPAREIVYGSAWGSTGPGWPPGGRCQRGWGRVTPALGCYAPGPGRQLPTGLRPCVRHRPYRRRRDCRWG